MSEEHPLKKTIEAAKEVVKTSSIGDSVSFSVDAGIIDRLGKELVGRAETAVSELVKNAYDADANLVTLNFINTNNIGGALEIVDDGHGMNRDQLVNGFMRLSSSDKFHNPTSPKCERVRAGKKGIGRFATQRLGEKLTIITKRKEEKKAIKIEISWNFYQRDIELSSVSHPISEVDADFEEGTKLIIDNLREAWSISSIKRVFRYVSELLQPDYLSDRSRELNVASKSGDCGFDVRFFKKQEDKIEPIASLDKMVFDHALGVIEGIAIDGETLCKVSSKRFNIEDELDTPHYPLLTDVSFKVYYYIYNYQWYKGYIPKMEYNRIIDFGRENGGIRLYRNGFKVSPYGEQGNDWLNVDKRSINSTDNAYVPFFNRNFFGFVEIVDEKGILFEETSSREGLLENQAFKQLTDFIQGALRLGALRINSARIAEKNKSKKTNKETSNKDDEKDKTTKEKLDEIGKNSPEHKSIIEEVLATLDELEMLRVLAAVGLTIAEFTHEIRQFIPSFNGSIAFLSKEKLSNEAQSSLVNLKENFSRFRSYTAFIDNTITQNVHREKLSLDLRQVVKSFEEIMRHDLNRESILFKSEFYEYDLITIPMHPSEWNSILYNLYTNSKKAINRAAPEERKIGIIGGEEKDSVYLEFTDNGDGIPTENEERIFDAFFTTSTPSNDNLKYEGITGTGLGLKIVKDIIEAYGGVIELIEPERGYNTCFKIIVPKATEEQLKNYGY